MSVTVKETPNKREFKQDSKRFKAIWAVFLFFLTAISFASPARAFDIRSIKPYTEIPGVTSDEITAIEALKAERVNFSYGSLLSAEAFTLPSGAPAGFSVRFCQILSRLFDIAFLREFHGWDSLKSGIDQGTIDFTGDLSESFEQNQTDGIYYMTAPVARRPLRIFIYGDELGFDETEIDIRGLRVAFVEASGIAQAIQRAYPDLKFEAVSARSSSEAAGMLESGAADAVIEDASMSYYYGTRQSIKSYPIFPLVYNNVTLATANPGLRPVISVVNKYIASGGVAALDALYADSAELYAKYRFGLSLTREEKAYLAELETKRAKIPVALERNNYPISFYDETQRKYQGIAPDILEEISELTGAKFQVVTDGISSWMDMLDTLKSGYAVLVSELQYSQEREKEFIWPTAPYFTFPYVFLSKTDYPNLEIPQVPRARVAIVNGAAAGDLYNAWFPNSSNTKSYSNQYAALDALERDEVDLFMTESYTLLSQMNYREKPGYKANIVFNPPMGRSFFGINKNETLLCSIVSKAQSYVDMKRIADSWTSRVYDYSRKYARELLSYLSVFTFLLFVMLIFITILYIKNVRTRELYKRAVKAAMDASKAKTNFLAKMSHEIRTPMNAIIGMTELALRENLPEAAREQAVAVKQASTNLLAIINDILDLSKIETGKLEAVPVKYLFSSLINDVISIIRMRVIDSRLRFVVNIDGNIPNALIGDETRIRQALLNILNNAVKYTDSGFVSLSVGGETADGTVNLTFAITDSGRGIKRENLGKLFGEYVQFEREKNKDIEGIGLGLAITWHIVKAMGGTVGVESEYGKGSTFTVTLPQKISSPGKLAEVADPAGKNIIVYERRKLYADSISKAIHSLGVGCAIVSSDDELREKLAGGAYNFLFVSQVLYTKNKAAIADLKTCLQVVLLTEFGESVSDKGCMVMPMPPHSISIANILNGKPESAARGENTKFATAFTAPSVKILVVDDINTNLKVCEGLLRPYQVQVSTRKNGAEAIEAVKAERFDLVFMDHKMPGMDGVEATLAIRGLGESDPYYKKVPIIALTANTMSGAKELFMNSGFDGFLPKPIENVKLNAILEKWLPEEKQKWPEPPEQEPEDLDSSTDCVGVDGFASDIESFGIEDFNISALRIDGLDIEKGIALAGGTIGSYLALLSVFYMDGAERMPEIDRRLKDGNLPAYVTNVHGMKSAAASVGANELSELAKALELAGKNGELGFLEKETPKFLAELKSLLEKIETVMTKYYGNENWRDTSLE